MEAKNVACAISCFLSQESANLNKFSGCPGRNRTFSTKIAVRKLFRILRLLGHQVRFLSEHGQFEASKYCKRI